MWALISLPAPFISKVMMGNMNSRASALRHCYPSKNTRSIPSANTTERISRKSVKPFGKGCLKRRKNVRSTLGKRTFFLPVFMKSLENTRNLLIIPKFRRSLLYHSKRPRGTVRRDLLDRAQIPVPPHKNLPFLLRQGGEKAVGENFYLQSGVRDPVRGQVG